MSDLAVATWPGVEAMDRRALVVPLGAIEQHGPHLPLDTDLRIAEAVAAACVGERPGVAVAPGLPFGASGEHAAFPGTLSIGTEALVAVLVELGRDASTHWPALLFVNAHGGNVTAVTRAVAQLVDEGRRCAAFHAAVPGGDAHAGRTETSLLLHLSPELVHGEAMAAGNPLPITDLLPTLRHSGVRAVSPNGILGDPAGASAEEGAALLATLASACTARLDTLLAGSG
ncbi:MAG TPA: mycofactocin biosynthesis peptidyl-dipeptidase MftE [Baekduia sp.]